MLLRWMIKESETNLEEAIIIIIRIIRRIRIRIRRRISLVLDITVCLCNVFPAGIRLVMTQISF